MLKIKKIKNTLSRFKGSACSKIKNKTIHIKNGFKKFKENFSEAKKKPRSKRKSLLLGFTTVLSLFGVTLVASVLPSFAADVAKDIVQDVPKSIPKTEQACPLPQSSPPPVLVPSEQIMNGLSSIGVSICALAVSSGSFIIGGLCGVIIVVGVLKAQGK